MAYVDLGAVSAYADAKRGGYTGSYTEFCKMLAQIPDIARVNANLLDNWYFGNPVNQRGASGTISTAGYFFDRWKLVSGSVTINSGGIVLNGTIAQVLEYAVGQAVTATVLTSDGVTDVTPVYDDEAKTFTVTAQGKTIRAVKLELGTQQTLAHQENGVWVLNEIPNYVEQLRRCQRFYYAQPNKEIVFGVLTAGKTNLSVGLQFPVGMWKQPTVVGLPTMERVRTSTGIVDDAVVTDAISNNYAGAPSIMLTITTNTFNVEGIVNNTPIVGYLGNVVLSAEP